MMTKYKLAKRVGITPTHAINILNHKEYASLPKAVAIEIATNGEVKVEEIVRPEVAKALKEYLKLRCPSMSDLKVAKEEEVVSNRE